MKSQRVNYNRRYFMKRILVILCTVMISCFMLAATGLAQDQDQTLIPKEGKGDVQGRY